MPRPATRPEPPMAGWAAVRLVTEADAELHPDVARADYVAWCSDRRAHPQPRSKMRAVIKGVGGVPKGVGAQLRFRDVALDGPGFDSGYRVPGFGVSAVGPVADPTEVLLVLFRAGLVSDPWALDRGWLDLSGSPHAVVCGVCGRITRRVEVKVHVGCQ